MLLFEVLGHPKRLSHMEPACAPANFGSCFCFPFPCSRKFNRFMSSQASLSEFQQMTMATFVAIIVGNVISLGCIAVVMWIRTLVKRQFIASAVEWKYDVFLSFRGVDSKGITVDIHDGLSNRGIKTFMADRALKVGDVISPALLAAIKESRFAIVVLSQNYASSIWCLEELREICQFMKDNRIFPLFYDVDPTDVRYQKNSFERAFSEHATSGRYESKKMKQWKAALHKVANISGWNTTNYETHERLVNVIVESVGLKVSSPNAIEPMGDLEGFRAMTQAMDEVMMALRDDQVNAVGVYGRGGVGKTTMVKHVGAQACKYGIFHEVIMAVVSQNPDFRKVQDALAEELGFKFWEETEIGRIARLKKEIMRSEKRLIILDDVWKRTELSKIGIPSYKDLQMCKSKILLTTRIENVCHTMDMECQKLVNLTVLSEEDSWTLFLSKARSPFESSTFDGVARKVAGECKGLPVALIAVARALGDKDLVEWEKAAQRLGKSQSATLVDDQDAFKCIQLSYDYLKDKDSKACFLLCCLFPEAYDIPMDELVKYAIGRGLFQDTETIHEARGRIDSVVKYLIDSSLLLSSEKNGCVKMHDVIRDTALNIAKSEDQRGFLVKAGCGLKHWPDGLHEGYSAVSLMGNDISDLPKQLVCPKLQILLLNQNLSMKEIPDTFFLSSNDLRILDLSWTNISKLPQSLGYLTNLRALYLDDCESIINFTWVLFPRELEILSMRNTNLKKLPRQIGYLTKLRVLDITGGKITRIPSKLLSKLCSLEELYLGSEFWDWRSSADEYGQHWFFGFSYWQHWLVQETNATFDEVTSLSKLRVLKVVISGEECFPRNVNLGPNWIEFNICVGKADKTPATYDHARTVLSLNLYTLSNFPDWFFDAVMNKTEKLEWNGCPRLVDIFVEYERGRLHGLKHLSVYGVDRGYWPFTWIQKRPVFKNLEQLRLVHVDCGDLCIGALAHESLSNLKLLEVESCYNWENVLLPSTSVQRLPNLEVLYCRSMKDIEYVFRCESLFEPIQSKLRKIELSDLDRVRSLFEGPASPTVFQNLQSLSIKQCKLQGSLFTSDVAPCLFRFKDITLQDCPLLERIVEATRKKIVLPKLETLRLSKLPLLSNQIGLECPLLEDLNVHDCPNVLVSVSDFHSMIQVRRTLHFWYRIPSMICNYWFKNQKLLIKTIRAAAKRLMDLIKSNLTLVCHLSVYIKLKAPRWLAGALAAVMIIMWLISGLLVLLWSSLMLLWYVSIFVVRVVSQEHTLSNGVR